MRVLITNAFLDLYGGSEAWCFAMASELKRRDIEVEVYTPMKGKIYHEFEKIGIPFASGGKYDLILDNHNHIRDFKSDLIIHTCHGIDEVLGRPLYAPNIVNVAVSETVAKKWNVDIVIPNAIDTVRFSNVTKPRAEIFKILSLCKSDTANDVIRDICQRANIEFECMYGKEIFNVEDKINTADLVIGVGRSLLDAMACGRPVVSFDDRFYFRTRMLGYGYITPDKFDKYRKDSFTGNAEQCTLNKLQLAQEIFRYNPEDGIVNRQHILEKYNIKDSVDKYLSIYNQMVK